MSLGYWKTLVSAQVAGASLSNTVTATSILPAQAKFTLQQNFLDVIGYKLLVRFALDVSNIVTTPGTLTLDIRFGATVVATSAAMQLSSTAHTTLPVIGEFMLTTRSVGSAATLMLQGWAAGQPLSLTAVADSTTTVAILPMPNTTPAVGNSFDSTATQQVDMFATFSIANAANLVQLQQYELINCT